MKIQYPDLPIVAHREAIINALMQHSVIIVAGETGSGKTTQLPKICLEAGLGKHAKIGHTQPRRLAARSVAFRIASELDSKIGQEVGYKIRFSDQTNDQTRIQIMTDGILLAETQQDKLLSQYDCIIIDEAHERSLNIDFLIGYLKNLIKRRPELKVIITSATIDVKKFVDFFDNAPLIEVEGRSYPVEVIHLQEDDYLSDDPTVRIAEVVVLACQRGPGDLLIFQSGEKEIRELVDVLNDLTLPNVQLLPLFARQTNQEQQRIFEPSSKRKIIISTNIAETSITVPNIRYVIDPGFARVSRYNYRNKLQRLPIEPISQASAEQRKGRCGRVGPGICYRLYDREDFEKRSLYTDPEIRRVNLAGVILRMLDLGFRPIETFPLLDPFDTRYVKDGLSLLDRLGAIDQHKKITSIGRMLARIPLEPRFGRMLIAGRQYHCLKELLIIVSAMSIMDVREHSEQDREKANLAYETFRNDQSDFLFYLALWEFLFDQKSKLSHNKFRLLCRQNYLSYLRVCEWIDVHQQLNELVSELNFTVNQKEADYSNIHRALLVGNLDGIGRKDEQKIYMGARDVPFYIHPGSVLFKKSPNWIMACEIVHTSKTYGRICARIEPEWIEEVGKRFLKHQYSQAHFSSKLGRVVAFEKVSLFGLELVNKRKINYEKINPQDAREIFIKEALCQEQLSQPISFYEYNHKILQSILEMEVRIRKSGDLLDEHALFSFYDKNLPLEITSVHALQTWLSTAEPNALRVSIHDILLRTEQQDYERDYPSQWKIQDSLYQVDYCHDLSSLYDGASLVVPIEALRSLKEEDFSWPIPGSLTEKIEYAIRSLPKNIRMKIPRLPVTLPREGTFYEALSRWLQHECRIDMPSQYFEKLTFPAHLNWHFKIIDHNALLIEQGDSLAALYHALQYRFADAFVTEHSVERKNITQWDFGDIPPHVELQKNNLTFTYFPALIHQADGLHVQLFEAQKQAEYFHEQGLTYLALCYLLDPIKTFQRDFVAKNKKKITLLYSSFGTLEECIEQILLVASYELFVKDKELCWEQNVFLERITSLRNRFLTWLNQVGTTLLGILEAYQVCQQSLYQFEKKTPVLKPVIQQIDEQLKKLFYRNFVWETPYSCLCRYPIYLKASLIRVEKWLSRSSRDALLMKEIAAVEHAYQSKIAQRNMTFRLKSDPLRLFQYQIEELRISLFAESLKALGSVSKARLLKILENLR